MVIPAGVRITTMERIEKERKERNHRHGKPLDMD